MYLNRKFLEEAGDTNGGEGAVAGQEPGTKTGADTGAGATQSAATAATATVSEGAGPTWPADWRTHIASGNEKELKQLERFASPADVWRKARALEQRLSSGELKAVTPFPDKGTPEQQNAWRAENGIPEAPDKYTLNLGEGVVLGEADKPIVDDFLKSAHAANMPANLATETIKWYMDFAEKQAEARHEADQQATQTFEDTMRPEWGQEYRSNLNSIHALLDMAPEGVKDRFLNGRLADGTPIGSDPDTLRWMANLSRQINPVTTLVPGAGANISQAIDDEIGKLEGMMGNKGSEYWKGPTSEKMQARYRDLIDARDRNKGRAA